MTGYGLLCGMDLPRDRIKNREILQCWAVRRLLVLPFDMVLAWHGSKQGLETAVAL